MSSQLEQEIFSQPEVVARLLDQETRHIRELVAKLPPFDYVLVAARGSSDHAATYAQYSWGTHAGYPVALTAPSLHTLYNRPPRMKNALVIGISQSGQSPDIITVLNEAKRQGRPTIAITNYGNSPLAAAADDVIEMHAGPERSVAATKTYLAQLVIMMLFAAAWSGEEQRFAELQQLPEAITIALQSSTEIAQRTERYRYIGGCVVIGRGYNYSTAFELALKLEELTYLMANAYSSADFRHGPIATVHEGLPTILIMPSGDTLDDMLDLTAELQQRRAELLIISDTPQALKLARTAFPLTTYVPEWISPAVNIIPGQLLALYLALTRGLDPDIPRGLNKITRTL